MSNTNSNSLPQSINILNQLMMLKLDRLRNVNGVLLEYGVYALFDIGFFSYNQHTPPPHHECKIPCDNIIMTIECVNDFNTHTQSKFVMIFISSRYRCVLFVYREWGFCVSCVHFWGLTNKKDQITQCWSIEIQWSECGHAFHIILVQKQDSRFGNGTVNVCGFIWFCSITLSNAVECYHLDSKTLIKPHTFVAW